MKIPQPLLSIITPVYNCEKLIESCMKSVVDQTCPHAEHIIVDGSSSDGTIEIVKRYAEQHPHIRWISEKDQGQSDAMNKGIQLAHGAILGIVNADDYYEPNVFNRVLDIFSSLPEPSLIVGNCNIWDNDGKLKYINKPAKLKFKDLLVDHNINPMPMNPSAYFYHKSLHEIIGLYDVTDHYAMDIDFILKAVPKARVIYINETWGNHRYIKGSKTLTAKETGQLQNNTDKVLNKHLKTLPRICQWYILSLRYFMITTKYRYYSSRLKIFINEPAEFVSAIARNFKRIFHGQNKP